MIQIDCCTHTCTHTPLQCWGWGAFQLNINFQKFLLLLFRFTYSLDCWESKPHPFLFFSLSYIFPSKFDVVFSMKFFCECSLRRLVSKSSNVSICLHFICHELHPCYTSLSDTSYQYDCFKILLAHHLGRESGVGSSLARLVEQPPLVPCVGRTVLTVLIFGGAQARAELITYLLHSARSSSLRGVSDARSRSK